MLTSLEMPKLSEDNPLLQYYPPLVRKALSYERQAVTPMHPIYQENKLTVWKTNSPETSKKVPLLLIPALINRHYILDLSEKNSLCKALSEAGYEVYMVDWGTASEEDRWMTFSDLFTGPMRRIVRKVTRDAGGRKPVLFGYCLGGIISNIYTSIFPQEVAGLIALTAPVDFSQTGIMGLWTQPKYLDPYQLVDAIGNVPPDLVQNGFTSLRPAQAVRKWQSAWEKQDNDDMLESFFTLEEWVNDNIPFPGGTWQDYIHWLYQDNRLFKDTLWIGKHHALLKNITCPVLNIVADNDHIAPPEACLPLTEKVGSDDVTDAHMPGGHVGIIASGRLFGKLVTLVVEWLDGRPALLA
ncbi:MAG: alpha/beta fold hydrolase [Candidatus Sericytochromatia bacterium]